MHYEQQIKEGYFKQLLRQFNDIIEGYKALKQDNKYGYTKEEIKQIIRDEEKKKEELIKTFKQLIIEELKNNEEIINPHYNKDDIYIKFNLKYNNTEINTIINETIKNTQQQYNVV